MDSNVDPATRRTVVTTLIDGETELTWNAGIYQTPTSLGESSEPTAFQPYRVFLPTVQQKQ